MLVFYYRQIQCNANCAFQPKVIHVFSGVSSAESFLYTEEVWNLFGPCFSFWCASNLPNPKKQPFFFYKKVVPLNFEFCSLGNEYNFLD